MIARVKVNERGEKYFQPLSGANGSGLPIGSVLPYIGERAPTGFLICDGSEFDKDEYPFLYKFLGDSNVLPDLRGKVLEMYGKTSKTFRLDGASANISGLTVIGQSIQSGLPNITGSSNGWRFARDTPSNSGAFYTGSTGTNTDGWSGLNGSNVHRLYIDASRSSAVYNRSNTVQPESYVVNYIIKAVAGAGLKKDESEAVEEAVSLIEEDFKATMQDLADETKADIEDTATNATEEIDEALSIVEEAKEEILAAAGLTKMYKSDWINFNSSVSWHSETFTFDEQVTPAKYIVSFEWKGAGTGGLHSNNEEIGFFTSSTPTATAGQGGCAATGWLNVETASDTITIPKLYGSPTQVRMILKR